MDTQHPESMTVNDELLRERIVEALRQIYDPELPVNIYDLGLIYSIDIEAADDGKTRVDVDMTLTAPACPVAGTLPGMVASALKDVDGVDDAEVELVWDPAWSVDKMSEDARMILGMYD
jgi:FeS assembly SUF system protein